MEDKRDFIEQSQSFAEKTTGKPASVNDMVAEFSKRGLHDRAAVLDRLDVELSSNDPLTLHQATKLLKTRSYHRALSNAHEAMRKAGR